jgi:hypothetical protein
VNRRDTFLLHSIGKIYGCRPSALLGVGDAWSAYQLDVAVLSVGVDIEAALAKGKSFDDVAGPPLTGARREGSAQRAPTQYRDPTPLVSERIAIPASGVW